MSPQRSWNVSRGIEGCWFLAYTKCTACGCPRVQYVGELLHRIAGPDVVFVSRLYEWPFAEQGEWRSFCLRLFWIGDMEDWELFEDAGGMEARFRQVHLGCLY